MRHSLTCVIMIFAAAAILSGSLTTESRADTMNGTGREVVIGYEADLFPYAASAAAGKGGFAFQTYAGIDHIKIRAVAAHIYLPDSLIGASGFTDYELSVAALIIDYVFRDNFEGFWIGTGVELWQNSITHEQGGGSIEWMNTVMTLGGGYIWKIYNNVYINPWAAVHYVMNAKDIEANGDRYHQRAFQASASIKIGFFFDL